MHPVDQEPPLRRTEEPERDERRDLREHQHAVWGAQLRPGPDAKGRARIPRDRDDDEADERDRGVAGEHHLQTFRAELGAQQHDREESAEPHGCEDEVQAERRDRGVVPRGAGGVPLLRHRHERGHREHRHEHEGGLVAHGEAQHRDGGGHERGREPCLAERDRGDELSELLPEDVGELECLARDDEEREDPGGGARDGEHRSGCRGDVEGRVVFASLRGERPDGEHQRAEHSGRAEVHQQLGDREPPPRDRPRILDREGNGAAAVHEGRGHRDERDGEEHGRTEHADGAGHRTSLDGVTLSGLPGSVAVWAARRHQQKCAPLVRDATKGRAALAARPFGVSNATSRRP